MAEAVEDVIRRRVGDLLKARPEVETQEQLGLALGRGRSWVSHFLKGRRHANEIHLLARIAKFFGVTVGYLLGETDEPLDPGAVTLLRSWNGLGVRDRRLLLRMAFELQTTTAEDTGGSNGGGGLKDGSTPPAPPARRARKHR